MTFKGYRETIKLQTLSLNITQPTPKRSKHAPKPRSMKKNTKRLKLEDLQGVQKIQTKGGKDHLLN